MILTDTVASFCLFKSPQSPLSEVMEPTQPHRRKNGDSPSALRYPRLSRAKNTRGSFPPSSRRGSGICHRLSTLSAGRRRSRDSGVGLRISLKKASTAATLPRPANGSLLYSHVCSVLSKLRCINNDLEGLLTCSSGAREPQVK